VCVSDLECSLCLVRLFFVYGICQPLECVVRKYEQIIISLLKGFTRPWFPEFLV